MECIVKRIQISSNIDSMEKINIIGYSGHSYVCIETAKLNNIVAEGYYDIESKINNPYNLKYLGVEGKTADFQKVFICIADNEIRRNIYNKLSKFDFKINLIHPDSIISSSTKFKSQTLVCAGSIINPQVKIGKGCIINTGSIIEHECQIGDFTHIGPGSVLLGDVKIGDCSFIGANSVIKQGLKIGNNVLVGAGAVVIHNIPDNTKVVGNPAKKI